MALWRKEASWNTFAPWRWSLSWKRTQSGSWLLQLGYYFCKLVVIPQPTFKSSSKLLLLKYSVWISSKSNKQGHKGIFMNLPPFRIEVFLVNDVFGKLTSLQPIWTFIVHMSICSFLLCFSFFLMAFFFVSFIEI